ncbi:aldehyde dehydrogenase family protein [Salinisphaera orenii]
MTTLHYINAKAVSSENNAIAESFNPNNGELVGTFADGGRREAEAAAESARHAFFASDWAQQPRQRAAVLLAFAEGVEKRQRELATLMAQETGKLFKAAWAELSGTVSELRFYAGLARTIFGRTTEVEPGSLSLLMREPAGVAGIIVPWNAPAILLVRSLAPAMAAGCTSVVKLSPQSALFQSALLQCLAEIDSLPAGVVNWFAETGRQGGEALVDSPHVDVISFTGSSPVGQAIMASAAPTLKRLNLELGGKAPCVVCADADPQAIAPRLAAAATIASGQQCTAADRVLVHESLLDPMRDALVSALRAIRVGSAMAEDSQMGPLIDCESRDRIRQRVDQSRADGEVILEGDIPAHTPEGGAFLSPSLVEVEDVNSPCIQEEFFGPILNLESFDTDEEAVSRANVSRFGLAASVWTHDGARAMRISRALRSGTVWINDHNKLFPEAETGGFGASGFGRLHGAEAMMEFLETKHVYQDVGRIKGADFD